MIPDILHDKRPGAEQGMLDIYKMNDAASTFLSTR